MPDHANPYDFVPFENAPQRDQHQTLDRSRGLSGRISYTLEVLTPLFIHQNPSDRSGGFARLGDTRCLPATSLKGALRSVHEIVTNSCARIVRSIDPPQPYRPCSDPQAVCPSCRVFGMVGSGGGNDDTGLAGRLFFADLPVERADFETVVLPQSRGGPKPEHRAFYRRPDDRPLGRKLYYHQREYRETIGVYLAPRGQHVHLLDDSVVERGRGMSAIIEVVALSPQRIRGELHFINLIEPELDALLYTLVLEPDLAHHIGYAKPYGLGAARIIVDQLVIEPTTGARQIPSRFLSYDSAPQQVAAASVTQYSGRAHGAWVGRGEAAQRSHAAFAAIAAWPQDRYFLYPSRDWFNTQRTTPLWLAQGRRADQLYPGAPDDPTLAVAQVADQQAAHQQPKGDPGRTYRGRLVRLRGDKGIIGGGDRTEMLYFDLTTDVEGALPTKGDWLYYVDAPGIFENMRHAARVRKVEEGSS